MTKKILTIVLALTLALNLAALALAGDKGDKIDLNKATVDELAKVPGLNQEIAQGIVELREERGEFVDLDELLDVEGIDSKILRQIERYIDIEKASDCNC